MHKIFRTTTAEGHSLLVKAPPMEPQNKEA